MFKKTLWFGILLVALVVLSGCGQYDANCSPTGVSTCYGKIKLSLLQSDGTCSPSEINIGGSCLAVGDTTTCSQLDSQSADSIVKLKWASVTVPKYNYANLCYPTCQADSDCGSGEQEAICISTDYTDAANNPINVCAPVCGSDTDCLKGLTHCDVIEGANLKYCVPDEGLSTPTLNLPPGAPSYDVTLLTLFYDALENPKYDKWQKLNQFILALKAWLVAQAQ